MEPEEHGNRSALRAAAALQAAGLISIHIQRTGFSLSILISGSKMVMEGHCPTPSLALAQKLAPVKFVHSCCREHLQRTGDQFVVGYF